MISADELRALLAVSDCVEVSFRKKDGTNRVMRATTKDVAPYEKKTDRVRPERDPNLVSAWSIDDQAWRTINADTVWSVIVHDHRPSR